MDRARRLGSSLLLACAAVLGATAAAAQEAPAPVAAPLATPPALDVDAVSLARADAVLARFESAERAERAWNFVPYVAVGGALVASGIWIAATPGSAPGTPPVVSAAVVPAVVIGALFPLTGLSWVLVPGPVGFARGVQRRLLASGRVAPARVAEATEAMLDRSVQRSGFYHGMGAATLLLGAGAAVGAGLALGYGFTEPNNGVLRALAVPALALGFFGLFNGTRLLLHDNEHRALNAYRAALRPQPPAIGIAPTPGGAVVTAGGTY